MVLNDYTGVHYIHSSPKEGFARVLDIFGTFDDDNEFSSGAEADLIALASDWYAVGADLYRATIYRTATTTPSRMEIANAE